MKRVINVTLMDENTNIAVSIVGELNDQFRLETKFSVIVMPVLDIPIVIELLRAAFDEYQKNKESQ